MKRIFYVLSFLIVSIFMFPHLLMATSKVVTNLEVTAKKMPTGKVTVIETGTDGIFTFYNLEPGDYELFLNGEQTLLGTFPAKNGQISGKVLVEVNDGENNVAIKDITSKNKPAVISLKMTAKDFEFDPSIIQAHKGDTVKITLTGVDAKHSFLLPAFNVNITIMPGKTKTFSFKVTKVGTFTFRCGVPCGPGHKEMQGTIIVS